MTITNTTSLQQQLTHRIDTKTKPVGSLGRLEEIALQVGLVQQTTHPVITHPHIVVFAGDHGIARTGLVNAYPQEVTAQMVLNFLNGGAAINVFCRQNNICLQVADAGVNFDFSAYPESKQLIHAKINYGTRNYLEQAAMNEQEVRHAMEKGKEIVKNIAATGCNCIGFGEMGIGNTSSASLIMSSITGLPLAECVGRGAGINDEQLQLKLNTLQQVYDRYQLQRLADQPLQLLGCVGGFEITMMAGAYLEAAEQRMIVVIDGFIATAALLVAQTIYPKLMDYCLFAHTSNEQGHEKMLQFLEAKPLLQLGLRLGEGTGAALAIPLIQAAVNFLEDMASFESAGVANTNYTN